MVNRNHLIFTGILIITLLFAVIVHGRNLDIPESIVLDSLVVLYEGVEFEHLMHIEIIDDCSVCHHHTTGTPNSRERCGRCHDGDDVSSVVACSGCHSYEPFSASTLQKKEQNVERYHMDIPGLKAVYHLSCMNCHEEEGASTGCQDCHSRTSTGDAFYNSGEFAPEKNTQEKDH